MNDKFRNNARRMAVIALLVMISASGCGRKDDLGRAKSVVETSLNSWKNAEDPTNLVAKGIEFTEPDWKNGQRLVDFTVKSVTSVPQQGPRVVVVLNLQDKSGMTMNTEVAYEVLLADKAKIGRDAFHVPQ